MTNLYTWIEGELEKLEKQGLLSNIKVIGSPQSAWFDINGQKCLNFCSNNYLGLANHPDVKKAVIVAIDKFGIGPGAVRSIAGTNDLHIELENKLAVFKKVEAVLTFPSGFTANLAVIPALFGDGDIIFSDRLNHASIIDGCRLSKARIIPYEHCSVDNLKQVIVQERKVGFEKGLIVTDGVFSMDGDVAPLPGLVELAKKEDLIVMTDDAHGEGVLGDNGRGVVDHYRLHGQVDIEVGTFSKAFGVRGGFVAGKKIIIDWLRQRGRPFLFSSAMTIPDTAACIASLDILNKSDELNKKLWENSKYFKEKINSLGLNVGNSQTPITPVIIGDEKLTQEFSRQLFVKKVFATAVTYPLVQRGKGRIRVMISAEHTKKDLDYGIEAFQSVAKELKII